MIADLRLGVRAGRALRGLAFLVLQVPLAALAALLVLLVLLGVVLTPAGIGVPVVALAGAGCARLLRADRRLANVLLRAHIPLPPDVRAGFAARWHAPRALLADRALWRSVGVVALKLPVTAVLGAVAAVPVVLAGALLVLGLQAVTGIGGPEHLGPWRAGLGSGLAAWALAVPAIVVALATLEALQRLLRALERGLLTPATGTTGPVRELLAESLGDRSVTVAYWLPEHQAFVDEAGRPVTLPEPGSGRAWTAVDRDGRRVAAILHDAALDTSAELVQAAAASSSLALDNERLRADLRAQLEELERSRRRIVEAADAARRRIERDLHDGAQQHLVALALELRLLRARMGDHELGPTVEALIDQLGDALAELRELARGIHPAILTEQGLRPAIRALTGRCPFVVQEHIDVPGRLPAAVESAVYFVVAEGLTNVAKYSSADRATVSVAVLAGEIVVTVHDDGVGGARLDGGSGLRGLQDRVAAVGGRLWVDSPPGVGTTLSASVPCGAVVPGRDEVSEAAA